MGTRSAETVAPLPRGVAHDQRAEATGADRPSPSIGKATGSRRSYAPVAKTDAGRSERPRERQASTGVRYWLIVGPRRGRAHALTLGLANGGRVLLVFSFEEEAAAFLAARGVQRGVWGVEGVGAGELLSMILEPSRTGAQKVALDPMPGVADEVSARLVGVSRDGFAQHLRGREASGPAVTGSRGSAPRKQHRGGKETRGADPA